MRREVKTLCNKWSTDNPSQVEERVKMRGAYPITSD